MVRRVRMSVPNKISGAAHYIAQVADVAVVDVYGAMLMLIIEENTMSDLTVMVRGALPRYRLSLTEDHDVEAIEE